MKLSFYSLWFVVGVLILGLYLMKYDVQSLREDNAMLRHNITAEKQSLEVLEAEWGYLNRPARLQEMAGQHLQSVAMSPQRMISFADLPKRPRDVAQLGE